MTEPHPPLTLPRRDAQQVFRQRNTIFVRVSRQARTCHAGNSRRDGLDDSRVTMPENRRAERGAEVEELPAALLNQSVAMPADEAHGREAQAKFQGRVPSRS